MKKTLGILIIFLLWSNISQTNELDLSRKLELNKEIIFDGPTGEKNKLIYESKGVIFCISPWNFPIAIFVGQIVAALLCGNTVIAKPAEQTSIISYKIIKLLFDAGLPVNALQLILGEGSKIGEKIFSIDAISDLYYTLRSFVDLLKQLILFYVYFQQETFSEEEEEEGDSLFFRILKTDFSCLAKIILSPILMIPAFSVAIFLIVLPRNSS